PRLQMIDDAPPLLAVRGQTAVLHLPAVAVVGARNASAAGLRFAERLAPDLGAARLAPLSRPPPGAPAAPQPAAPAPPPPARPPAGAGGRPRPFPPPRARAPAPPLRGARPLLLGQPVRPRPAPPPSPPPQPAHFRAVRRHRGGGGGQALGLADHRPLRART